MKAIKPGTRLQGFTRFIQTKVQEYRRLNHDLIVETPKVMVRLIFLYISKAAPLKFSEMQHQN